MCTTYSVVYLYCDLRKIYISQTCWEVKFMKSGMYLLITSSISLKKFQCVVSNRGFISLRLHAQRPNFLHPCSWKQTSHIRLGIVTIFSTTLHTSAETLKKGERSRRRRWSDQTRIHEVTASTRGPANSFIRNLSGQNGDNQKHSTSFIRI